MTANYEEIKDYLLGKLTASDYERVDMHIIEDEEYAADAMTAEDRLIEEYVDGDLTQADSELFRTNYLTTDARSERLKQFAALRAAAVRHSKRLAPLRETEIEAKPSFWDLLRGSRPAMGMAAIALLVVAGLGIWMLVGDSDRSALESEYAELNRVDKTDLSKFGNYTAHEVTPGTFRSTDDTSAKLNILEASETILFRLPIAFDPGADAVYRVDVSNGGQIVFTVKDERPVVAGSVRELRVLLPRRKMKKGQNQITLTPAGAGSPIVYTFTADEFATEQQ